MLKQGTQGYFHFVNQQNRLLGLTHLVIGKVMADLKEYQDQLTGRASPEKQRPLPDLAELQDIQVRLGRYSDYAQLVLELTYCRILDSFLQYLNTLLIEILTRDENLRVKGMQGTALTVSERVEAEIRTLTGGVGQFANAVKSRYRLVLFASEAEREAIERLIETRHVFTHNHGIVDHRALKKLGPAAGHYNQPLSLTPTTVGKALGVVSRCVEGIEVRACKRFKLPTQAVPELRSTA
jgi:hypothetical protein